MKYPYIFVGTYHKTGTVWIQRVMKELAASLDLPIHINQTRDQAQSADDLEPGIYFDDHSYFPVCLKDLRPPIFQMIREFRVSDFSGYRMVRDPRDVVISGAHYHTRATESWLHTAKPELNGKTYQEAINSFDTMQERYVFEMEQTGKHTIECMAQPNDFVRRLKTVRYEDLMVDAEFSRFRMLMESIGLREGELDLAVEAFKMHSLIGDTNSTFDHGTSGGKLARWKTSFSPETAKVFSEKHGAALIALGYEKDHAWIDQCVGTND